MFSLYLYERHNFSFWKIFSSNEMKYVLYKKSPSDKDRYINKQNEKRQIIHICEQSDLQRKTKCTVELESNGLAES